jgi:LysM repeat protein
MKRFVPLGAALALAALPFGALAAEKDKEKSKRTSSKEKTTKTERVETTVSDAVTGTAETKVVNPGTVTVAPAADLAPTTAEGATTTGVTRSTGAGIGEGSTRSDVGTGRGGAGMNKSGTLAPSAIPDTGTVTTIPGTTTTTVVPATPTGTVVTPAPAGTVVVPAAGDTVIRRVVPGQSTGSGNIGAGTSTPAGAAPGK